MGEGQGSTALEGRGGDPGRASGTDVGGGVRQVPAVGRRVLPACAPPTVPSVDQAAVLKLQRTCESVEPVNSASAGQGGSVNVRSK